MKGVLSVQVTVASLVVSAFTGSANNVKGCGELHTQLPIAKESQCQRDPLHWDGLVWSRGSKRGCMGETIGSESQALLPGRCNQADSLDEQVTDEREAKTKLENLISFLSDSSLCHASSPLTLPRPASHSLFLYSWTAFMEERRQTWTQPWSQTLVNTSTYFSPSLLLSFSRHVLTLGSWMQPVGIFELLNQYNCSSQCEGLGWSAKSFLLSTGALWMFQDCVM